MVRLLWLAVPVLGSRVASPYREGFEEARQSWADEGLFERTFSSRARSLKPRDGCDVPRYSLVKWAAVHGDLVPDHPCVFVAERETTGSPMYKRFQSSSAFFEAFGDVQVFAEPGYTQAGGHLAYFKCAPSLVSPFS